LIRAGEAVVERGAAEPVPVGDLDDRYSGPVQAGDDVGDLLCGVLVSDGVRAVAQSGIRDAEGRLRSVAGPIFAHVDGAHAFPPAMCSPAMCSPAICRALDRKSTRLNSSHVK